MLLFATSTGIFFPWKLGKKMLVEVAKKSSVKGTLIFKMYQ